MDITAANVAHTSFRTVRKGYDPGEVDAYLQRVARALEEAQQQATAMEARARAAVSRLQEQAAEEPAAPRLDEQPLERRDADALQVSPDEPESISRTLLLAQRTADTTITEAQAEAERLRSEAQAEADSTIDSTREMAAKLLEAARIDARKLTEAERQAAENEVESLVARREFLVGDVDELESFLADQRERLRAAARQIEALCDRVPAGLASTASPLLSASDDEPGDETSEFFRPPQAVVADMGDGRAASDHAEPVVSAQLELDADAPHDEAPDDDGPIVGS